MFLAVDIGNTRIKIAVFDKNKIIKTFDYETLENERLYKHKFEEISTCFDITDCAIISVVEGLEHKIKEACDKVFGIKSLILNTESSCEIKIAGSNPKSAGMDRLANVYAIINKPLPAIVVDIGTAITFDILSANKEFLGGVIMPGVNMSLKSLAKGTSKLPEIKVQESPFAIGNSTETCILSGVIRGTASAIDGLLEQCIEELGECRTIVLTGGQAELVSKYMKFRSFLTEKDLTMVGIKNLYELC